MDRTWPKAAYQGLFHTEEPRRYTPEEVLDRTLTTTSWGPWNRAFETSQKRSVRIGPGRKFLIGKGAARLNF